jgi:ADP-heptose:LPS heptosyltransferase
MKVEVSRISLGNFISRNKVFSFLINSSFNLFFQLVRTFCKIFAYKNGQRVVISLHRLGDTIFTIPAIRELQKYSNEKITIVCFPDSIPIYKLAFKDINFCELEHRDFIFNHHIAKPKVRRKLKALRPSVIIDLIGGMSSASILFNSRAEEIIGISKRSFSSIYGHFVEIRNKPQLIDIYLDAISSLIQIPDRNELKKISRSTNPEGKILIHPFAAWIEKEWNLRKFIELALKLKKDFAVNFISPPGKIFTDVFHEINKLEIDIIETSSVEELIQNINECSLFIGNDSGPVNIANFLGKPTFTIYGATNPDFTSTYQEHQLCIQKKLDCSARSNEKFCIIGGAEFICPGIQCINSLSVDEVFNQLNHLANKYCNKK